MGPNGLNVRSNSMIVGARGFDASPASSFIERRAEDPELDGDEVDIIDKRAPKKKTTKAKAAV